MLGRSPRLLQVNTQGKKTSNELAFFSAYLCVPLRLCGKQALFRAHFPQRRRGTQRYAEVCFFLALWQTWAELYFSACRKSARTKVWPPFTFSELQVPGEDTVGAVKALAVSEGAELVRRCRAGDGAAWEEIVQN
jgi:hypothetical protein